MPVKPRITLKPGKTYTYVGTDGTYSVIAGEVLEGDSVQTGGNIVFGDGAPSAGTGKTNDVYIDTTNFKLHTKGAGGWDSGSGFKGTNGSNGTNGINGSNGTNGKSVRFGNGAPSSGLGDNDDVYLDLTDFKLHTKSAGAWSSGSAFKGTNGVKGASLLQGSSSPSNSDGDDGDTFLDAVNHTIYKKQSGSWVSQGSSFKGATGTAGNTVLQGSSAPSSGTGADGDTFLDTTNHIVYKKTGGSWASQGSSFKGSAGADGAGLKKYSAGLTTDTTVTTSGATLAFADIFENVGSVVTMDVNKSVFTIPTSGKYNVKFTPTFDVQNTSAAPSAHTVVVDIMAAVEKQASGSSSWATLLQSTSSIEVGPSSTAELEFAAFDKTLTFATGTKIRFTADRSTATKKSDGTTTLNCVVKANAVDDTKGDTSSDTWMLIQKL